MEEERKKMWKESMGEESKTLKTLKASTDEWVPILGDDDDDDDVTYDIFDVTYDLFVEPTQEDLEKAKKKRKIKKEEEKKNMDNTVELLSNLQGMVVNMLAESSVDQIANKLKPQLDEIMKKRYGIVPSEVHTIQVNDEPAKEISGVTHEEFETVLALTKSDIPVYLNGPAGTGKNVICKQVAEALGLDFYFTNAVTQEYKLTGFIDANGNYQSTQFYDAFTKGGLFFLDEMDASIPEVLVILNAAIANRYFNFPTGKVTANPNFRVIAAGNTAGKGADNNYTGRYCLDGASLDRFAVVEINYSPKIENAISGGDEELLEFARGFRRAASLAGIDCLFSYRAIERIHKMAEMAKNPSTSLSLGKILKIALLKGLDEDDITVLVNRMDDDLFGNDDNVYYCALKDLVEDY